MSETKNTEWYKISNISELDSPALVVFPQRVKANIQTAINMVKDIARLRPHIKTNKSPDATCLLIDAGVTKFKCATIAEAEMLGQCNAKDVLLAYQPNGPKLKRFMTVINKYTNTKFSCLVDNDDAASQVMATAFSENGLTLFRYISISMSDRTEQVSSRNMQQHYMHSAQS